MHDEREDALVVNKAKDAAAQKDAKNGKELGLELFEVGGVFDDREIERREIFFFNLG